jgi:fucose permease
MSIVTEEKIRGIGGRVALTYAAFVLVGVITAVGGVALPAQIADYGVDRTVIGLTFFTFSAGFMVAGVTTGHLIHRAGIRWALVVASALFTASCLVTAVRPPFTLFVLIGVPSGYAVGVLESVLNVYLAGLPKASTRLGRLHAFFGVGALVGPLLAARVLLDHSWTAIWLVLTLATVPFIIGFALLLHRDGEPSGPSTGGKASPATADPAGHGLLSSTVRQRAVLLGGAMLVTYVGVEISVGSWAFSFLVEGRGTGTLTASKMVSGYWLGLTLGRFLISPVADRLGWSDVRTTSVSLGGVVVAALLTWIVPSTLAVATGLVLMGFFLGPVFPNVMAAAPRLTDPDRVPTAIGFLSGVSVLGGSVLPWFAGAIIQHVGLWTLLPFAALLSVVQLAIWGFLGRALGSPGVRRPAAASGSA